ncbi:hypothetical protein [Trichocoleus sp. DQ-U1]|uniref:hypothetical protein n=1 Tax=Trichocoleus sp. DQ-U1 TaxID=2933926 RepID=UPI003298E46B
MPYLFNELSTYAQIDCDVINLAAMRKMDMAMDRDEIAGLGASLRRINQKLLTSAKGDGVERVWYQGGEPYFDLFIDLRKDDIEWFQLTLRGKSLSWNRAGWQTGITNEGIVNDITFYPASKLIKTDNRPDFAFIELAYSILQTRAGDAIVDKILVLFKAE